MGEVLEVNFERKCETLQDLAVRYRVLATLHPEGVKLTFSNDQLRTYARIYDGLAAKPAVLVVERETALPGWMVFLWAFMLSVTFCTLLGDAAWALSRFILGAV